MARAEAPEGWEVEDSTSEGDEFELESEEEALEPEEGSEEVPEVDSSDFSPEEDPNTTYYFVGGRYRAIIVPQFLINAFGVDGGRTVFVNSGGVEFGIRRDGFEILPSIWFANYSLGSTPFKGSNDGPDAWEIIESQAKVLYLTADFLWSTQVSREFSVLYGVGAGLGIVLGDITRTEGYFPGGLPGDPNGAGLQKCTGPGNPSFEQCPADGQYNQTDSWPVYPWLAVQTGLRYKPHKSFVARLDVGFGSSGFFLGLGADYGL